MLEQTLLQDTQQRLQDVENQRAGLEVMSSYKYVHGRAYVFAHAKHCVAAQQARNKVLEQYAFAQSGPSTEPSPDLLTTASTAAPEVGCLFWHSFLHQSIACCSCILFDPPHVHLKTEADKLLAAQKVNTWSTLPHAPEVVKALLLPSVRLTCGGRGPQYMTPFDISQLPLVKYAKLYTVSILPIADYPYALV